MAKEQSLLCVEVSGYQPKGSPHPWPSDSRSPCGQPSTPPQFPQQVRAAYGWEHTLLQHASGSESPLLSLPNPCQPAMLKIHSQMETGEMGVISDV